jgi:cytochrome c oxidase subunit 2
MIMRSPRFFPLLILAFVAGCGLDGTNPFVAEARVQDKASRQIEIYARQFSWTVRYAGIDNVLGKSSYKFVTEKNPLGLDSTDVTGYDDIIVADTFFLPVNEKAAFEMHSRDVLHSVYFPHFRVQMNIVPGITTTFSLTPEITTKEMRANQSNPAFDYFILCNKICGARHFEMKMKMVVGTREEFSQWLKRHKPFFDGQPLPQQLQETEGDGSEEK